MHHSLTPAATSLLLLHTLPDFFQLLEVALSVLCLVRHAETHDLASISMAQPGVTVCCELQFEVEREDKRSSGKLYDVSAHYPDAKNLGRRNFHMPATGTIYLSWCLHVDLMRALLQTLIGMQMTLRGIIHQNCTTWLATGSLITYARLVHKPGAKSLTAWINSFEIVFNIINHIKS